MPSESYEIYAARARIEALTKIIAILLRKADLEDAEKEAIRAALKLPNDYEPFMQTLLAELA